MPLLAKVNCNVLNTVSSAIKLFNGGDINQGESHATLLLDIQRQLNTRVGGSESERSQR